MGGRSISEAERSGKVGSVAHPTRSMGAGAMATHVVLLRGIGPVSHRKMTMSALEAAARAAGLPDTSNLLATGNLVVRSDLQGAEVERILLGLLAAKGVETRAVTCDAARISALPGLCPDREACAERPAQVQVTFLGAPLTDAALATLRVRAAGERVERIGRDLWIDYRGGISQSKLTGPVIERATGTVATARNWNTVLRLDAAL